MKENYFKCAICGKVFESSWSEEEALAELVENFGKDCNVEDCEVVCDDCYQEMIGEYPIEEFLKDVSGE
jgi:hypothetical protein